MFKVLKKWRQVHNKRIDNQRIDFEVLLPINKQATHTEYQMTAQWIFAGLQCTQCYFERANSIVVGETFEKASNARKYTVLRYFELIQVDNRHASNYTLIENGLLIYSTKWVQAICALVHLVNTGIPIAGNYA